MRAFLNANKFPWSTFIKYWTCSSRSELIVDLFFPFLIACAMVFFTSQTVALFTVLIEKFQQISGQLLTAVSILAGFNVASITIISTVQSESIKKLKQERSEEDEEINLFEEVTIFFSWAVVIQLIVAFLSIVLFYFSSFIPEYIKGWGVPLWAWIIAVVWLALSIHSIFISIRNMKTLYHYVNFDPNAENSST